MLLTGFCLGCITAVFLSVFRDYRQTLIGKLFLALLVAASSFLIHDTLPKSWHWLSGDVMTVLPALFWALCIVAFKGEDRRYTPVLLIALYSFIAPALARPFGAEHPEAGFLHFWAWHIPQLCEYVIIISGIWGVVEGWQEDLWEQRRKLRAYTLLVLGSTALCVTFSLNMGLGREVPMIAVTLCSLVVAYSLLSTKNNLFEQLAQRPQSKVAKQADSLTSVLRLVSSQASKPADDVATRLCDLMASGYYRCERLTLRRLAQKLDVPEHRLRNVINQRFNYRNFSDYINQLRIEEASHRLAREPNTPIQNIALDIGYRTMSSFNRAFRDVHNCTPTEFRARRIEQDLAQQKKVAPVTAKPFTLASSIPLKAQDNSHIKQ